MVLHVRTKQNPASLFQPVREIMHSLDPALPFTEVHTLYEEVDASLWQERLLAALASAFGALATVLAAIGLGWPKRRPRKVKEGKSDGSLQAW
jgi:hypothetical protein